MFLIDNDGKITISRGDDSGRVPLFINAGSNHSPIRYELKEGETVYLGVYLPNSCFEKSIIKKSYSNQDINEDGDVIVTFDPDDTVNLFPGSYYYEIKAKLYVNNSNKLEVNTIIPATLFEVV